MACFNWPEDNQSKNIMMAEWIGTNHKKMKMISQPTHFYVPALLVSFIPDQESVSFFTAVEIDHFTLATS